MGKDINSYLVFKLSENEFAIHVGKVVEILEYRAPLPMPDASPFFAGIMEHREEMIPVVDPSKKFGLDSLTPTEKSCIIVLELSHIITNRGVRVGIIVDTVTDVFETEGDELKSIQNDFKPDYILGTYKKDSKFYMVLNADKVFSTNEIVEMEGLIRVAKKEK